MLKYLSILIVCFYGTHSQIPIYKKCPNVQPQTNFQINRFLGTWYEAKTYPHTYEANTACVKQSFFMNSNGSIHIEINWKNTRYDIQKTVEADAQIYCQGYVNADIDIPIGPNVHSLKVFWILETDYDNYAVLYTCEDFAISPGVLGLENSWIVTRSRNPSNEVLDKALDGYTRNNLNTWLLRNSIQNDCA